MSPILKDELEQQLIVAKENLEKIYEYKTKGAILRSKNRQYKDGEKNLKYLKRYFKREVIGRLRRADNTTLTTDNQECVDFYSELYGSRPVHNGIDNFEFFPDKNTVWLDDDSTASSLSQGLLTVNKCLNALKTMEANKSQGSDGFPAEFCKVFWNVIATPFVNAFRYFSLTKEGKNPSFSKKLEDNFFSKLWL